MAGVSRHLLQQMTKLQTVNRLHLSTNGHGLKPYNASCTRNVSNKSSEDRAAGDPTTCKEKSKSKKIKVGMMILGGAVAIVATPLAVGLAVPVLQSATAAGYSLAAYAFMGGVGAVAGSKAHSAWGKFCRSKDESKKPEGTQK